MGTAIYRLSSDNLVTLVAGHPDESGDADGTASSARFRSATCVTADGAGTLFVKDGGCIRRVQLPRTWLARPAEPAAPRSGGIRDPGAQAVAVVTTLASPAACSRLCCISDGGKALPPDGALIVSSKTALYRMPLGNPGSELALWAGQEGGRGALDRRGLEARFHDIYALAAGGDGCVYVVDGRWGNASVRRVDPSGAVTTIASDLELIARDAAILPNGYLAIVGDHDLRVLDLGLPPPRDIVLPPNPAAAATAAAASSPARTLPGDLGALLDRQPDGTADLEVVVGDRAFAVHRALLAARSDYFRQLLGGGFAEGGAARLSLPDADSEAFALALRFLYTGAVDVPAAQVRPVAELADRLLLPELCRDAQERLLAEIGPESVVDAMLWAEGRGPGFSQLLAGLKAWCLEHYEEVVRLAGDSVDRLAVERPLLMAELAKGYVGRAAKRPRPA
ncbi:hypothetical protein GPECTOR_132g601 [Gonium pectorale]|uniref:BTB domain-containing protein n=1 Tax=Gonium pectorale TaxID=33097 RepID=A0A150FYB4_GONPE|nr:hypothetical protein GPECTOR_132g601 [Gonium pectorale]|eukprot:KXZ42589.1 hypothetical protein GPECTOR_132g601 [Gonium pectorale]